MSAFTLVEVMIGSVVLTFALGSSLVVLGRGFGSLDSARWITYSGQIMQSEFEKMRLTSWNVLTDATTGYHPAADEASATSTSIDISSTYYAANYGDMLSRMTLTRQAWWATGHTSDQTVIAVKLTMTWRTRDGRQMSRSYITYYAKNGLYDYFIA